MNLEALEAAANRVCADKDVSIGNDLVFMPDFERSFNPAFQKKVYTEAEISYCEQFDQALVRYASTWAAKEAVYKSIKPLISVPVALRTIEIIREKVAGKPHVRLPTSCSPLDVRLSITHDGDYVWAIAITTVQKS